MILIHKQTKGDKLLANWCLLRCFLNSKHTYDRSRITLKMFPFTIACISGHATAGVSKETATRKKGKRQWPTLHTAGQRAMCIIHTMNPTVWAGLATDTETMWGTTHGLSVPEPFQILTLAGNVVNVLCRLAVSPAFSLVKRRVGRQATKQGTESITGPFWAAQSLHSSFFSTLLYARKTSLLKQAKTKEPPRPISPPKEFTFIIDTNKKNLLKTVILLPRLR